MSITKRKEYPTMRKKPNGTGTVAHLKNKEKPYLAYGPWKLTEQGYKRKYLGAYKTYQEADLVRANFVIDPGFVDSKITLQQLYNDYTQSRYYKNLSDSTKYAYRAAFNKCTELHKQKFTDIKIGHLQQVIDRLDNQGKSYASIAHVQVILSVLYDYAQKFEITDKDYAKFIELPNKPDAAKRALTDIEIMKIKAAAQKGNQVAQWTIFMIYSGWRISEFLELTQFNYNADERYLTGGKKTAAGKNRIVPVHEDLQWILKAQLAKKGETIFCNQEGKKMTSQHFRKNLFYPLLQELNIDSSITPHATRHTFATLLKRNGADDFFIKKLIGHSLQDITSKVYTHAEVEDLRKAIQLLKAA